MAEQLLGAYLQNRLGSLADNQVFSGGLLLVVVGLVAAWLHWLAQELWDRLQRQFLVSLEVRKEDEAFAWLMKWLAVQTERTNGRELSMLTTRENRRDRYEGAEAATKPQLHFGPAPGLHFLRFRGRWITVERIIKENQFGGSAGHNGLELQETLKLTTYGRQPQILKDIAAGAMNHALGDELGKVLIFQPKYGWGGTWRKLMAIEKRAIGSVHFPTGTLEKLLADVREFFAMRDWYKRRGIPHRRGIMLYGPPGNGKSSFAAALAGELGLNLCVCSLASASLDDDSLQEFLRKMPKGSILLLEDIDAAFVHRKKNVDDGNSNKVTFSGLLNALDGAVAFEGSLVLMTTNHRELLDPALTRAGLPRPSAPPVRLLLPPVGGPEERRRQRRRQEERRRRQAAPGGGGPAGAAVRGAGARGAAVDGEPAGLPAAAQVRPAGGDRQRGAVRRGRTGAHQE